MICATTNCKGQRRFLCSSIGDYSLIVEKEDTDGFGDSPSPLPLPKTNNPDRNLSKRTLRNHDKDTEVNSQQSMAPGEAGGAEGFASL